MELMFATKLGGAVEPVGEAAGRLFGVFDTLLADPDREPDGESRDRFKLLFAATVQGTATLIVRAAWRATGPTG